MMTGCGGTSFATASRNACTTSSTSPSVFSKKYDDALGTNFLINISPIDLSLSTWSIKEEEVLVKGTHDSVSLIKFFLGEGQQRKRRLIAIYYDLNFLL
jgi:hypothetical protein